MGPLFERYFRLLAGRLPGTEYGVIASPDDEESLTALTGLAGSPAGCLCPAA